ncbi:aldehyde dehydrogenase family protein [Mycolicibacterium smegmatis]|uniref:aldehyde dehydrogenase family protein n=1 Tax=Mycolicibacterium smegmatis TaxID=1772 RepID=UPI001E3E7500|nr:aldehyde dehydrogenase family protein [Mycolicibacterium smegmatis]UGU34413.1 aldehyde dehydrogenase family protein [Mycolicibacterium smegmatis]ULN69242.1 aldehyde dehydrogenase family protein [Mycolicibacterium smegmatis]
MTTTDAPEALEALRPALADHAQQLPGRFGLELAGQITEAHRWHTDLDPATGEALATVASATAAEIDQAVAAASAAAPAWASASPGDRGTLLRRLASLVRREAETLARLETRDTGKPLSQGRADIAAAARYFEFYGSVIEGFLGDSIPLGPGSLAVVEHVPHGVTGHIIPWNYPAQITARSIGAALAVGNATVVKPADEAPLVALMYARLAREAGFPAGVLNVLPGGAEAGAALTAHPGIAHISFTGSVPTGRLVAAACAERGRPSLLELGGKSAHVVLEGADIDRAAPVIARALLLHAGQTCTAGTRVIVHESLHRDLVTKLAGYFTAATLGPGLEDPAVGPVVSRAQAERVEGFIERAQAAGARLAAQAEPPTRSGGYFVPPVLFDEVGQDTELFAEEVFGPVLAVTPVGSDDEAVQAADNSRYGLTAAVWSTNIDRALRAARRLDVGQAYINGYAPGGGVELPFGGTRDSGYGREKGVEALREYSAPRTLFIDIAGA